MKRNFFVLLVLTLLATSSIQVAPVQANGATEIILTLDDLVGKWNGIQTIDLAEGDKDPEWVEYNRYVDPYQVQIKYWANDYWFYGGWRDVGGLILQPDGSFSGRREYISNVDGSLVGIFTVEGTVTNKGGQLTMNCRMEDIEYESPSGGASHLIMTFNGVKEGTITATPAPPATTAEPPDFGMAIEKGRISFARGEVYIQRDGRIIEATTGEGLLAGDILIVEEGGEMTIAPGGSGTLKLIEKTRFQLPEEAAVKKTTANEISKILGNIWSKTKEFLSGESFKVKTPDGECGVRG